MSYMTDSKEKDEILMTEEGYERKLEELEEYREKAHEEIPAKMKQARSQGVVDENVIQSLQREQSTLESEIRELEQLLNQATIMDQSTAAAGIGHKVLLYDLVNDRELGPYKIVPPAETGLEEGRVSVEAPTIRKMLDSGAGVGDEFNVETPSGTKRYRIEMLE